MTDVATSDPVLGLLEQSLLPDPGRSDVHADLGTDPAAIRRRELGAFLRSRRERISPQQVGMVPGGRRRTPGLRRERWPSSPGWA